MASTIHTPLSQSPLSCFSDFSRKISAKQTHAIVLNANSDFMLSTASRSSPVPRRGGWSPLLPKKGNLYFSERLNHPTKFSTSCCVAPSDATISVQLIERFEISHVVSDSIQQLVLADLDPATAKLAITILGPFLSVFGLLFVLRIVMSWYPKLPVGKFPYVIAYAPTEPILVPTRKLIPPVGGVDVTPVVWFGLTSFLNEILLGPQGLLVLLSQQDFITLGKYEE